MNLPAVILISYLRHYFNIKLGNSRSNNKSCKELTLTEKGRNLYTEMFFEFLTKKITEKSIFLSNDVVHLQSKFYEKDLLCKGLK